VSLSDLTKTIAAIKTPVKLSIESQT